MSNASAQEYTSKTWRVECYPSTAIGIVIRKSGKTEFCFGGASTGIDEMTMRGWADDVLKKLDAKEKPSKVREWVLEAIRA